jgi:hypothetical protein
MDKNKQGSAESQQGGASKSKEVKVNTLQPLPEGRPIAANDTGDTAELLGYLD